MSDIFEQAFKDVVEETQCLLELSETDARLIFNAGKKAAVEHCKQGDHVGVVCFDGLGDQQATAIQWTGEYRPKKGDKLFTHAMPKSDDYAEGLHPDTKDLVIRFSIALAEKLRMAEIKYGYSNAWLSSDWMDECRDKLYNHLQKGDPRDVAAYCAFLWHHNESTTTTPQPSTDVSELVKALNALANDIAANDDEGLCEHAESMMNARALIAKHTVK